MSTTDTTTDNSLASRIQVEEREERIIEEYPSNIADQLQRAAFDQTAADTFVKHHRTLNGTGKPEVVEVQLNDDQLTISVNDVVGVINLTPTSKLQINPKIGWNDILEIFLTVEEQDRSLDYHGIPIRDFLADDLQIEDIFVVVAVNYLNSLEPIFRHGFVREYDTHRVDAINARGQIDIDRSLKNHVFRDGVPKQHFVQKVIDYSTPANVLIYEAGQELRRLFQHYANTYDHDGYYRIFSRLEETLNQLEALDVKDDGNRLSEISNLSLADLPRQRHYYKEALNISKTILSSSIGEPLDHAHEDLTMDYILSMESLFERYANLVLQEQLQHLQDNPLYTDISSGSVDKESHHLFTETDEFSQQPDHVLRRDGEPVAVLDTKYYAEDKNPLKDTYARSRLLAYAHQLEVDEVAFLCPLGESVEYSFANRAGNLKVISPDDFSIDTFTDCIHDYLCNVLHVTTDNSLQENLTTYNTCHPQISAATLDDVLGNEALTPDQLHSDAFRIFKNIVNRQSNQVSRLGNLQNWQSPYQTFESYIEKSTEYDYALPLFIPAGEKLDIVSVDEEQGDEGDTDTERLVLHCFTVDSSNEIVDWETPKPLRLNWEDGN